MDASPLPTRYQLCLIGYRRHGGRLQFRLVTQPGLSRWSFPEMLVDGTELLAGLRTLAEQAGVVLVERRLERLGEVDSTRRDNYEQLVAVLAEVDELAEAVELAEAADAPWRSRWCFAEEARVRIRRKPLRRLVDQAVRRIEEQASESSE